MHPNNFNTKKYIPKNESVSLGEYINTSWFGLIFIRFVNKQNIFIFLLN